MADLEIGQKRTWYKSRRTFVVDRRIEGTRFVVCKYEDGTEEHHANFIVDVKSYEVN